MDDGLDDVVDMVMDCLVDSFAKVDDGSLLGCVLDGVLVRCGQSGESALVLVRRDVALLNVSLRNLALVVDFGNVLGVLNGLNVVLNVGDVSLVVLDTLDLLDFVLVAGLVDLLGEVGVVVSSGRATGVKLVGDLVGTRVTVVMRVGEVTGMLAADSAGGASRFGLFGAAIYARGDRELITATGRASMTRAGGRRVTKSATRVGSGGVGLIDASTMVGADVARR